MPAHMAEMSRCVRERDFQAFGQLTMKDSNQFHATCLDTFPPISYLSDTSRRVIRLVHCFNAHHGRTKAGAGPGRPGAGAGRAGASRSPLLWGLQLPLARVLVARPPTLVLSGRPAGTGSWSEPV